MQKAQDDAELRLSESRAVLEAGSADMADIEAYLYEALSVVYYAKVRANRSFDPAVIEQTNEDLHALVELGYLDAWPGNPLDSWSDLPLAETGDSFVPAALLMVICPASYNTTVDGSSVALSFNLYVNAPDSEQSGLGNTFSISGENREWGSSSPAGAMHGLSFYGQSDALRARLKAQPPSNT